MNFRFLKIATLISSSVFILTACSSDNSSFETPGAAGDTPAIAGTVSQRNLSLIVEDAQPQIYDATTGVPTDTTLTMTVKVGDSKNQLLTDAHTIYFATEWGLIDRSCTTENGSCTVSWQTSFAPNTVPADHRVTIMAYTLGEEHYSDSNGNGTFDDGDTIPLPGTSNLFDDRPEPFVDANEDDVFNTGDTLIDVINGNALGQDGVNNPTGDTFLNSPSCTHSSLCSTTTNVIYIWDDIVINMDGPPPTVP